MKLTQKYTIAQLFKPLPDSTEYSWAEWPPHVTIADVFAVELNASLIQELSELLAGHEPFTTIADHDEYFGPEKQTHVMVLNKNQKLAGLHQAVVDVLKSHGVVFNNPKYMESGFKPHSTIQSRTHMQIGDTVAFNALTIIDMFPDENPYQRKVLKTLKLGEPKD